jgi:hypothetical protein
MIPPPMAGASSRADADRTRRLKQQYFDSDDQLVTLRMFSGPDRDNWMPARWLGLRIITEFNGRRAAE